IERLLQRQKGLDDELKALRAQVAAAQGKALAAEAADGVVVARRDGLSQDQLRDLAVSVRSQPGIRAAVLVGTPDGDRVAVVATVAKGSDLVAGELAVAAARATGGGGNPKAADLAVAGGKDVSKIDEALAAVKALLSR
ncbi:MAG: alanine--tRNA ligase, partial [Actinobacteria bacterium]|nr:alanine--tRNA ligase [Actinomycetota bacterium]